MPDSKSVAQRIIMWYSRHRRHLPWRETRDPYAIWVSEVMLQQTQVGTVIPYYHRFLSRFPTVEALAKASLQEVLKAWEDMGYYGRARRLHETASKIMAELDGRIPGTREQLLSLPGIGPYTASAILSFAFGRGVPAIDGNVRRVLCRLFAIRDPVHKGDTLGRIARLAEELVPAKGSASFNQGLMDLGATLCTPRNPSCALCPIKDICLARQRSLQEILPVTRKRAPLPHKEITAAIISDPQGRLLIVQRSASVRLLGGLWKFPGGEKRPGQTLEKSLRTAVNEEVAVKVRVRETVAAVKHAYTHFRITLHAFRCVTQNGKPHALGCERWLWATRQDLDNLPFSRADRKIIEALGSHLRQA